MIVFYPVTARAMIKWYLAVWPIHWVPYDKYFRTTQINSGFYIYTLERSFCLINKIMINIWYISRCVIQISKTVRFMLHALSLDNRFSSYQVKHSPPTALLKDARARRRCERLPLNIHAPSWQRTSDTPQSNTECCTDITLRARIIYTTNVTLLFIYYNKQ